MSWCRWNKKNHGFYKLLLVKPDEPQMFDDYGYDRLFMCNDCGKIVDRIPCWGEAY